MTARIGVVGAGYVGLTTAVCMAHLGHDVVCVDIDPQRVDRLNRGELPIVEAGMEELLGESMKAGRLRFALGCAALFDREFVFLSVQTPMGADGSADLTYVAAAARELAGVLPTDAVVINKSTMPVGSVRFVERTVGRSDVRVVSNPEFLREGTAVHDFLHPDRIVIGSDDQATSIRVAALYLGIPAPLIVTDPASAELIKYASNSFLAAKLSFVNAIAAVCEAVGADVADVVLGMGSDKRIGQEFLRPGPGWGGSCLPKDTRALVKTAEEAGYDFDLLRGVITVNDQQYERVVSKITEFAGGTLAGATVAVWGLTFKARTDDLRDSPALEVVDRLLRAGAVVQAYDPTVDATSRREFRGMRVCLDPYSACQGADVLALLTEWDEFRWLDFDKVAGALNRPHVVDGRNLLDRAALARRGFRYAGIGR